MNDISMFLKERALHVASEIRPKDPEYKQVAKRQQECAESLRAVGAGGLGSVNPAR